MRSRTALLNAICFAAVTALAQQSGGIVGKIIDKNGVVITGIDASIHLRNTASGQDYPAVISREGSYAVNGLPAGAYDLNIPIACCMYRSYAQKSVTIKEGETLTLDLNLDWGINLGTIGDDPGMLGNDMRARAKDTAGPTPRMPDGKVDFSGMWYAIPEDFLRLIGTRFPLQPWAADMQKKLMSIPGNDQNPASYCLPQSAIPTMLPFPQKIIQTPTQIIHLVEFMTPGYRQIFLDNRKHPPEDWNPAWMGHSVAHWEGDTLVIDTVGFNEVAPGFAVHSEKLHVIERFRRPDRGHLEVEITAEDPEAYTGVYQTSLKAGLTPGEEILEFVCPENNKDPLHFGGLGWKGRP